METYLLYGTIAYIDPGTGSLILQILLAGIAGLGVLLKLFWARIKAVFAGSSSASNNVSEEKDQKESNEAK